MISENYIKEARARVPVLLSTQGAGVVGVSLQRGQWPDNYTNSETGKPYEPHHEEEALAVNSDAPRYILFKGGEGCVAAETLINGIPAAEWRGGHVETMYGPQLATAGYRKGRADLYRVRTQSGRVVVVTLDHRFLTPDGWRPLRCLSEGSLLAAHDSDHDAVRTERAIGLQDRCSRGSRPCGALSSPVQVDALSRLQRLAKILFSELGPSPYGAHGFYRPYSGDVLSHAVRCLSMSGAQRPHGRNVFEGIRPSFPHGEIQPLKTNPFCRVLWPQSDRGVSLCAGGEYPQASDGMRQRPSLFEDAQQSHGHSILDGRNLKSVDVGPTSLSPYLTALFSAFNNSFIVGGNDSTTWDCIDDISFIRNGDFYDLSVPDAEHYSAHGLWHHNSGKSVAGIIKDLNRLRRGMSGILGSSDLPHFKKSLWPEFRRWCPPNALIENQRYRLNPAWEPQQMFTLSFTSGGQLICGGFDDPSGWEGPNVNFAHWDESRRHKTAAMLKVLAGRVRIPGPNGEPPQIWLTSTPKKHWMFDYFGPLQEDDPLESFKQSTLVVTLRVKDNVANLDPDYERERRTTLTEAEARVLMEAEWEDIETTERFLPSIAFWDACLDKSLPSFDARTPTILAADGAVSGDTFGLIGVSRHPHKPDTLVPRIVMAWNPHTASDEYIILNAVGKRQLNYDRIEDDIKKLCKSINVLLLVYDPKELHQMMTRLRVPSKMLDGSNFAGVPTEELQQGAAREIADKNLLDLVLNRRIAHDGNKLLRQHLDNADRKTDGEGKKLRIVKREEKKKIDLAVCASMACYKESILPLPTPTVVPDGVSQQSTWNLG